eukprot:TRINITY_DN9196_c0_g1_i2.p1 TRINITY_DN9196_c0_g1~~TRINITY_DN9196_c0_g1_i2.p1  ORF type:complete len:1405 (+),score=248.25 TRINITY_DN9196_c0_g1_i2:96-4310(+)
MAPVPEKELKVGSDVFVPSLDAAKAAFYPGTIVEIVSDSDAAVIEVDGEVRRRRVAFGDLRRRFRREDGSTSSDSTAMVFMNDASILENLRLRHNANEIYTYTASVLLAVNPYKQIDSLYGEAQCSRYRSRHIGALPPHPYAIADSSYRMMGRDAKNQAMLISGESGAGKTETAKIVMQFLAYISGTCSGIAAEISSHVLNAQSILESLGNAATLRNTNSSRFGKYNKVFFDDEGALVDSKITTYLLESSRVVAHAEHERNYHVFYEILSGLGDDQLKDLRLKRDGAYRLLHNGRERVRGFENRDVVNYTRLIGALTTVGLDDDEIAATIRIIAGLVHLGDAAVEDDAGMPKLGLVISQDENPMVEIDMEVIRNASDLLGFDAEELAGTLRRKRFLIQGTWFEVARTPSQFRQTLHSLIKGLYKRVFEQIVKRINKSFTDQRPADVSRDDSEGDRASLRHIGILDIYGFERLQRNSFEQLCINLANERLQQYFVENVLLAEQSLYSREALTWTELDVPDSSPTVNCITQVFTTLDDYSCRLAKGLEKDATDERFCKEITEETQRRSDILKKTQVPAKKLRDNTGPAPNESFTIRHYAGVVEYYTPGWLDKNNDRMLAECEALMVDSKFPPVQALAEEEKGTDKGTRSPFRSISKKYQQDLEALLLTLSTCHLHYIRCFKPNEEQKPDVFVDQLVLDQIVQCGTIELVKIMHDGYPNRCTFGEINDRFRCMLPTRFQRYGMRTFIEALMLAYEVPRSQWALGMSRLFLKAGQLKQLEDMRSQGTAPSPEVLARIVRGIIRRRWSRAVHAIHLCMYIPRLIARIHVDRAAVGLCRAAAVTSRLIPRLEAARRRLGDRRTAARRRLRGGFHAVHWLVTEWRRLRRARKERLQRALWMASFLVRHTRHWVNAGRKRVDDVVLARQRERRRLQEEQRRIEEEQRRIDEELRILEEDHQRVQERRRKELEERRAARAARLAEEEAQAEKERAAKEREDDKLALAEERQLMRMERIRLEDERKAFEREREIALLRRSSPQGSRRRPLLKEDPSLDVLSVPVAPCNDISERVRLMEQAMLRKQEEVLEQMRVLQARNDMLEKKLLGEILRRPTKATEGQARAPALGTCDGDSSAACPSVTGGSTASDRPSLIPISPSASSNGQADLAATLAMTSAAVACRVNGSGAYGGESLQSEISDIGTERRCSLISLSPTDELGPAPSIAETASTSLRMERESLTGVSRPLGDPVHIPAEDIDAKRKWWNEQRDFLMEDLYPHGSPAGNITGSCPRNKPSGVTGGVAVEPVARQTAATATAIATTTAPATVTALVEMPTEARGVRNLNDQFLSATGESVGSINDAAAAQAVPEENGMTEYFRANTASGHTSKLKKPQFFRTKRSGDDGAARAPGRGLRK